MRGRYAGSRPWVLGVPSALVAVVVDSSRFLYTWGRPVSAARTGNATESTSPTSSTVES